MADKSKAKSEIKPISGKIAITQRKAKEVK